MRRPLVWVIVGGALVVYMALSWGVLSVGGGQATPVAVEVLSGPVGTPAASPAATGSAVASAAPSGPAGAPTAAEAGLTPEPLPAGALAQQGQTFILVQAGVVTHEARVALTGQGFMPSDPLTVTIKSDALPSERMVARGFANKDGQLENVGFDVPADLPPGRYVVSVSAKSGKTAQASFQLVEGQPGLSPDVYAAKPGSPVKFTGGGFQPGERVNVYFDSLSTDPLATVEASQVGTVKGLTVNVPLSPEGQHAFLVVGERSQTPVRVDFSVTGLYPWINVDNYTPLPQQAVGVTGEDFYPGERVRLYLNAVGAAPLATATASAKGALNAPAAIPIPVDMRGAATVIAVGEQSGQQATADITVGDFTPALELTVYSGSPGTNIAFTGSGFAANETVHVYSGRPQDKHELTSFETGPNGAVKAAGGFELPLDTPAGKLTLTAVGEKSKAPISLVFAVQGFQPALNLTSYAGKAGDTTSFTGSGYVPGETLRAYLGKSQNGQEVASLQVGADGAFKDAGAFVVPQGTPPGQLSVTVVGDRSKTPVTVEYTVLPFTPWAGLSAYSGPVGSKVSFIGGSFAPGEIVDVHLGDASGKVVVSATADDEGKFPLTDPFVIPAGAPDVSFTLVGETSKASVTVKFAVTSGSAGEGGPADEKVPGQAASPSAGQGAGRAANPAATPTAAPSSGR